MRCAASPVKLVCARLEIAEHRVAENLVAAAGLAARLRSRLRSRGAKVHQLIGIRHRQRAAAASGRTAKKSPNLRRFQAPSDRIATSVMNGDLNSVRKARRRLGMTERLDENTVAQGLRDYEKIRIDMVKTYGLTHVAVAVRDLDRTAGILCRDPGRESRVSGCRDSCRCRRRDHATCSSSRRIAQGRQGRRRAALRFSSDEGAGHRRARGDEAGGTITDTGESPALQIDSHRDRTDSNAVDPNSDGP